MTDERQFISKQVSQKTDLQFPITGQQGHGHRIIHAALATVLAESIVAIIQVCCAWNEMKEAFARIEYIKLVFINILSGIFLIILRTRLLTIQSIARLFITCCAFFVFYACMLLIFKDSMTKQYVQQIIKCVFQKTNKKKGN